MRECAREMPEWYRRGLLEQSKPAVTMTPQIRPQHLRAGVRFGPIWVDYFRKISGRFSKL